MTLHPAVAAVRLAVRNHLLDVGDHAVLVACSGGADSLALLAATVFEARREPWHVVGVTVDHGLQEGSAGRAGRLVQQMAALGAAETVSVRVDVQAAGLGIEAAARQARYAVLEEVAERFGSSVVLLGHTLDDQAETVLMGLTRGSGGRSIAGMREGFDCFRRPLLRVRREQTEAACRAEGIDYWEDPHNMDPRFTRARIRHRVLPVLEAEMGPGVAEALARTADMLRDDLEALDMMADSVLREHRLDAPLPVDELEVLHAAVRLRVLRLAALRAGCPSSELFRGHVLALDALVSRWHGQRWVDLPGHVRAYREGAGLSIRRTDGPPPDDAVAG